MDVELSSFNRDEEGKYCFADEQLQHEYFDVEENIELSNDESIFS